MIIIIIIAVIVLISGLGLITGGLNSVKNLWESALGSAEADLRENPSYDKPIVWSLGDVANVDIGKTYVIEVGVLNTQNSRKIDEPSLDCVNLNVDFNMPTGPKEIESGDVETWKGTFKISGVAKDTYICTLEFKGISEEIAITTT
jgi:hypothetical protein